MAKGTRSNHKKQLNTWKRERLTPGWQAQADERRYAALAAAAAGPSVEPHVVREEESEDVDMDTSEGRGRKGQPKAVPRRRDILPVPLQQGDGEEMETDAGSRKKGKGKQQSGPAGGRIQKRRQGKLFLVGQKNQFHGSKRSKSKGRK